MLDIIEDTLIDAIKLLPFLFITFLIMEYIEHKLSDKSKEKIEKSGKYGPIVGSILGMFPQCGFSVAATNLYATRVITLGTLISVYLATSDEMLPILISYKVDIILIISILALKVIIGMICGFLIDKFIRIEKENEIKDFCDEEHCDCDHGILKSTVKHTLNIFIFIVIAEFILNIIVSITGLETLESIFMKNSIFGSFITSLIGLIPNCAASVVITELYLNKVITFGSIVSGLLASAGVGFLVLFKTNKNIKENVQILMIVYIMSVVSGILIDIIDILI